MPENSWFRRTWSSVYAKITGDYPERDEPYHMRKFFKQQQENIQKELTDLKRPGMEFNSVTYDQAAYYFARDVQGRPIPEEKIPMLNEAANTLSKVGTAMVRGRSNVQEDINKEETSISRLMYAGREGLKYLRQHPVYGKPDDGIAQLAFITKLTSTGNCDEHATRTAIEHFKSSKIPGETVIVEHPIDHSFAVKKTPVGAVVIDKWTVGGAPLAEDSNFYRSGAPVLETKIDANHVETYDALLHDRETNGIVKDVVFGKFRELNNNQSVLDNKYIYGKQTSVYSRKFIYNTAIKLQKPFSDKDAHIFEIHAAHSLLKQGATILQAQDNAENVLGSVRDIFDRYPEEWRRYAPRSQPASAAVEERTEPTTRPQAPPGAPGVNSVQTASRMPSGASHDIATGEASPVPPSPTRPVAPVTSMLQSAEPTSTVAQIESLDLRLTFLPDLRTHVPPSGPNEGQKVAVTSSAQVLPGTLVSPQSQVTNIGGVGTLKTTNFPQHSSPDAASSTLTSPPVALQQATVTLVSSHAANSPINLAIATPPTTPSPNLPSDGVMGQLLNSAPLPTPVGYPFPSSLGSGTVPGNSLPTPTSPLLIAAATAPGSSRTPSQVTATLPVAVEQSAPGLRRSY
ncbi:hypothetical protein [Cupriavidus necator]